MHSGQIIIKLAFYWDAQNRHVDLMNLEMEVFLNILQTKLYEPLKEGKVSVIKNWPRGFRTGANFHTGIKTEIQDCKGPFHGIVQQI